MGTRSAASAAKHTDFERFVEGAFGVIGIEKRAREAVKRHVKARNKPSDNFRQSRAIPGSGLFFPQYCIFLDQCITLVDGVA